jgi:hypothetical protein
MRPSRLLTAAGLSLTAITLCACTAQQSRLYAYRHNPTPELDTNYERHDDIQNHLTNNIDTNFRSMNEDIGRVLLLDRPSRMARPPIPY